MPALICDFCSGKPITWQHFVESFAFLDEELKPLLVGVGSSGNWAACDICHSLVAAGDRAALLKRSVDTLLADRPGFERHREPITMLTKQLHAMFWERRLGVFEPITEVAA